MKKFFRDNWVYLVSGLLVLGLFLLRLYNLTILPVFADEAIYIRWAQVMRAEETLRFLPLSDGKQPLFMWMLIPFLKVFSDPLFAGRFVSVASGFGTLIGVALLSWLLFKSKRAALVAALIYSVSPLPFFFDRMALADSMLSMFGVWTFIFAHLAFTKERYDFAMVAGFSLGAAWLTKSPALFFALMLPLLWLFASWKGSARKIFLKISKLILLTLPILAIGYGMYNILRLGPNFSVIARRNLDYVWPLSHILSSPLDPLKPFLDRSREWIFMMGPWGIFPLAAAGVFLNWVKMRKQIIILIAWFFLPIVVQSEYAKVLTARYILFSIPYLVVIASSAFRHEGKKVQSVLIVVLSLFIAQSLVFDKHLLLAPEKANLPRSERSGYLEEWTAGYGISEIAGYLKDLHTKNPEQKIIAGTEGFFGTLPDGLQIYLNGFPEITVIGVGLDFDNLPKPLLESKEAGNTTYLIVNKSRFHKDPSDLGLRIVSEYPKAVKPDGSYDALILMEVTSDALKLEKTSK